MMRWVKLIAPYAILLVLSIPGSAQLRLRMGRETMVRDAMLRMKYENAQLSKLGEGWTILKLAGKTGDRELGPTLARTPSDPEHWSLRSSAPLEVSQAPKDGAVIQVEPPQGEWSYTKRVPSYHDDSVARTEQSDGVEERNKIEEKLRYMQMLADKVIERAAIVADYHADFALQIRAWYPHEVAPTNVESHIQASDAARQEVKKLQGTINRSTTEAVTVEKASRATIKASEAQDERHKAEKAATADER